MKTDPSGPADLATLGIALLLIYSFLACVLRNIFYSEKAEEGRRYARSMRAAVALPAPATEAHPDIILPLERRVREEEYPSAMSIDWDAASPQERTDAVLSVLPTHYADSNGITATDVAHRLGVGKANRVTATLGQLTSAGQARAHFDKANRRRRVYWRTGSNS